MPVTLLAVDDSVTMRKVLEMTFAGEDFRVVTADNAEAALALVRSERPAVVVADITLPGKSGYDMCQAIKREIPHMPVLLLSSRLHPYDAARGKASLADDHIDKPFDTQQLIDRVRALLSEQTTVTAVQGVPKTQSANPYRTAAPVNAAPPLTSTGPQRAFQAPSKPSPAVSAPAPQPSAVPNVRSTAEYPLRPPTTPITPPTPAAAQAPTPAPARTLTPAATAVATAAAPKLDQAMSQKLTDLGLTKEQISGVLALSQEVVERVVWEVVPVLAETLIKEEIKRLMAE